MYTKICIHIFTYTVLQNLRRQIKTTIFSTSIIDNSNCSQKKKLFKWNQIATTLPDKILRAHQFHLLITTTHKNKKQLEST